MTPPTPPPPPPPPLLLWAIPLELEPLGQNNSPERYHSSVDPDAAARISDEGPLGGLLRSGGASRCRDVNIRQSQTWLRSVLCLHMCVCVCGGALRGLLLLLLPPLLEEMVSAPWDATRMRGGMAQPRGARSASTTVWPTGETVTWWRTCYCGSCPPACSVYGRWWYVAAQDGTGTVGFELDSHQNWRPPLETLRSSPSRLFWVCDILIHVFVLDCNQDFRNTEVLLPQHPPIHPAHIIDYTIISTSKIDTNKHGQLVY